jgi:hypothetical protein
MTQYAHALLKVWPEASKAQAAILWAQFAVETGAGACCWNWNLGNVKHVKGDGFDYMALKGVWEIVNGQRVEIPATDPGAWFRSYPDLDTAMHGHFVFLQKHYAPAWKYVIGTPTEGPSVESFVHALKVKGYFTAPEDAYRNGMKVHFDKFMVASGYDEALAAIRAEQPVDKTPQPIPHIYAGVDIEPLKYDWTDDDRPVVA